MAYIYTVYAATFTLYTLVYVIQDGLFLMQQI